MRENPYRDALMNSWAIGLIAGITATVLTFSRAEPPAAAIWLTQLVDAAAVTTFLLWLTVSALQYQPSDKPSGQPQKPLMSRRW